MVTASMERFLARAGSLVFSRNVLHGHPVAFALWAWAGGGTRRFYLFFFFIFYFILPCTHPSVVPLWFHGSLLSYLALI